MKYYLLYRIYSKRESVLNNKEKNSKYYGWTNHKLILKLFFKQRDLKKYEIFKYDKYEIISDKILTDLTDKKYMIVPMELASVNNNGKKIKFYTTYREERDAEVEIKRRLKDASSLIPDELDDENKVLRSVYIYCAIKEKYLDALDAIGYFPPEVQSIYDGIDDYYDELQYNSNISKHIESNMGSKPYHQVSYSLESFVKVLKDDM